MGSETVAAIPLGRSSPSASCDRPRQRRGDAPGAVLTDLLRGNGARCPYLVLLPVGFSVPPPLPAARCAFTAPFHPYRPSGRPNGLGGIFSVALSLGSPPPGVTRHRTSVEPGLSSPGTRPRAAARPSGDPDMGKRGIIVKDLGRATRHLSPRGYGLIVTPTAAANSFLTLPANNGLTSFVV